MRKLRNVMMALALVFIGTNLASAQQSSRNGQKQQQFNQQGRNFDRGLNLSEDQETQIEHLQLVMRKKMLPLHNELGENDAKLRTLSTSDNVNMKDINGLIDANSKIRASIEKLKAANHQEFRNLLTPDQRVLFDTRMAARSGKNGKQDGRSREGARKFQGGQSPSEGFK